MARMPACLSLVIAALLGGAAAQGDEPTVAGQSTSASAASEASVRTVPSTAKHSPAKANAAKPAAAAAAQRSVPAKPPLDLAVPPVDHVLSADQRRSMLQEDEPSPVDDVEVQSERYQEVVPQGQLRAIPWAFLHPLSAWRLFTPVTE